MLLDTLVHSVIVEAMLCFIVWGSDGTDDGLGIALGGAGDVGA